MERLNKTVVLTIMPIDDQNNGNPFKDINPERMRFIGITLSAL